MKHFLVIFLLIFAPLPAHADLGLQELLGIYNLAPEEPPLDSAARERRIETLKKGIADIDLYWHMNNFDGWIHSSQCAEQFRILRTTYEDAERLDQTHKDNPTKKYQKLLREAKKQNEMARNEFEKCYTATLRKENIQDYNERYVKDYNTFQTVHKGLRKRFDSKDTAALHKKYLEELKELENFEGDKSVIARLVSVFKDVEVKRGDKWIKAEVGMIVQIPDEIRTGKRGRARLEFNDYHKDTDAGPTIINIGSRSHIRIEDFRTRFSDPPERTGLVDLLRGTVRAFTKNWGFRSAFSVRTGTSLCGIRGTDISISYDPDTDEIEYMLDHGVVEIKGPGKTVTLRDSQKLKVVKGVPGPIDHMTETDWMAVVNKTSAGPGMMGVSIAEGVDEEAVFSSLSHMLTSYKYLQPKQMKRWTTGEYRGVVDRKSTTLEGLRSMRESGNMPTKWNAPCLGECSDANNCQVYIDVWLNKDDGKPDSLPFAYIFNMKKIGGVWKTDSNVPNIVNEKHNAYERKMKLCGLR